MTIFQLIADAHRRSENSLNRAEFHKNKNNEKSDDEALHEYIDALEQYCLYLDHLDSALKQGLSELRNFSASSQEIKILFQLYRILAGINTVSGSLGKNIKEIAVYSAHAICLITDKLGEKSHEFNVDTLKLYEELREIYELKSTDVQQFKSVLDGIKAVKPKNTENADLQKIRISLQSISSCEYSCPIFLGLFEESKLSSGCFIATAAYGTANHPDLHTFRCFRDRKLRQSVIGRFTVFLYYKYGPKMALFIKNKPRSREFIQGQLVALAKWMRKVYGDWS